jgi:hypothetical protein
MTSGSGKSKLKIGMNGDGSLSGLKLSKSCSAEEEEEEEEEEEVRLVKEARQILLSMNNFNGEKVYTYHSMNPQHQRFEAVRQ